MMGATAPTVTGQHQAKDLAIRNGRVSDVNIHFEDNDNDDGQNQSRKINALASLLDINM